MSEIENRYDAYIRELNSTSIANARLINEQVAASPVTISIEKFESHLMPVLAAWCLKGDGEHFYIWRELLGDVSGNKLHSTIDVMLDGEVVFVVPPPYNELNLAQGRDAEVINTTVSNSIFKLGNLVENGETRSILQEDSKIETALQTSSDNAVFLRNVILLAKIWKYYDLDVSQILGGKMLELIDLNMFDVNGKWIGTSETPGVTTVSNNYEEDAEYEI